MSVSTFAAGKSRNIGISSSRNSSLIFVVPANESPYCRPKSVRAANGRSPARFASDSLRHSAPVAADSGPAPQPFHNSPVRDAATTS